MSINYKLKSALEQFISVVTRTRAKFNTLVISNCFYEFGTKSTIVPPFRFKNLYQIKVSKHVTINQNCWIQVIGKNDNNDIPKVTIGNYTSIGMGSTITAAKSIIIGDYVSTGRYVFISDHLHEYRDVLQPIKLQGVAKVQEVIIGSGTWIGQGAVILSGALIGKNCVIGANAVVNSVIPDYSVAAGIPARIIKRYNFAKQCWLGEAMK
jgi:acetyltransferase-like isoleucine patch superfamily enzyme